MFRSLLADKSRQKAAIMAGALVGVLTPLAAQASLTITLQTAPGAAGATQTVKYLTPDNNNTDVPVYVYATVKGGTAVSASNFQGIDYAYYNVNFANVGAAINATLDSTTTALNPDATFAFNAQGAQKGAANTSAGLIVGSITNLSDMAKPRSANTVNIGGNFPASPVWNGASATGADYYTSPDGKSVSFLVETLMVKPSAFTASTLATQNYTKFTPSVIDVTTINGNGVAAVGANWYEDSSSQTISSSQAATSFRSSTTAGSYTASTLFATFEDTLAGDANGNGTVDLNDINTTVAHFSQSFNWAGGDYNGNGTVDLNDLNAVIGNFTQSLTTIPPTVMQQLALISAANPSDVVLSSALASVPEPASLGIVALAGLGMLGRRRRQASK